jgi:hypothetical protein
MKYKGLVVVMFALLVPGVAFAAEINRDWTTAKNLGKQPGIVTQHGQLGATSSVRFYRLEISSPTTYQIDLDIDGQLKQSFHPRIVVYRPDTVTAGPALPMIQPPSTVASVYATSEQQIGHEGPWLSIINHRFHATVPFETAGTYYVAVYNAGTVGGPFRLTLLEGEQKLTAWQMTMRWCRTGMWVGAQWWNIIIPIIFAVIAAIFWYIIHRLPHPSKRHVKKR